MRGRFSIYDDIEKFTADLINFKCPIDVSSPNFSIDFALSDERGLHPVPPNHSVGRRLCPREVRSVGGVHGAFH